MFVFRLTDARQRPIQSRFVIRIVYTHTGITSSTCTHKQRHKEELFFFYFLPTSSSSFLVFKGDRYIVLFGANNTPRYHFTRRVRRRRRRKNKTKQIPRHASSPPSELGILYYNTIPTPVVSNNLNEMTQ